MTGLVFLHNCCIKKAIFVHYAKKEYDRSVISIEDETIRKLSKSLKIDASFLTADKNVLIFKNSENKDTYTIQFPKDTETTIQFDIDMAKANVSDNEIELHKILNLFSITNPGTIQFKHNNSTLLSFKELKIEGDDLSFNDPKIFLINIIASLFPLIIDSDYFDSYKFEFVEGSINKIDIELIEYRLKEGSKFNRSQLTAQIGKHSTIKIIDGNYDLYNNVFDGHFSIDINLENYVQKSEYAHSTFDQVNFKLLNYEFYNSKKEYHLIKTNISKGVFISNNGQLKIDKHETLDAKINYFSMDFSQIQMQIRNSDIHINGNANINLDLGPIYYETSDNLVQMHIKEFYLNELNAHFSGNSSNLDKIELKNSVQLIVDSMVYQKNGEMLSLYEPSMLIHPSRFEKYGSSKILILDSLKFSANNFTFEGEGYQVSSTKTSEMKLEYHMEKQDSAEFEIIRFDLNAPLIMLNYGNLDYELEALSGQGEFRIDQDGINAHISKMNLDLAAGSAFGNENYSLVQDSSINVSISDFNLDENDFYGNVRAFLNFSIERITLDDNFFSTAKFSSRVNSRVSKNGDDLFFELLDGTIFRFKDAKIKGPQFDFESKKIEVGVDNYFSFNLTNGTIKL